MDRGRFVTPAEAVGYALVDGEMTAADRDWQVRANRRAAAAAAR